MAFWGVRAGSGGEQEQFALENDCVVVGWDEVPDLMSLQSREALKKAVAGAYPEAKDKTVVVWVGELWAFSREIAIGDLIALPRRRTGFVAFGEITGEYRFHPSGPPGTKHRRPVRWIEQDFPRQRIAQDIKFSLGATLAVFQVRRDDAEERMRALLAGNARAIGSDLAIGAEENISVERTARDRIIDHIGIHFSGHRLEELVEAILRADGFVTDRTAPGPDGGIDILAGRGMLGFEHPRLAVQVKSSQSPCDVNSVRELQGAMHQFGADLGLYVAWGGFRGTAPRDARRDFFKLRLWDAETLLDELLRVYDRLPSDLQAELPLKRVWTLVEEVAE